MRILVDSLLNVIKIALNLVFDALFVMRRSFAIFFQLLNDSVAAWLSVAAAFAVAGVVCHICVAAYRFVLHCTAFLVPKTRCIPRTRCVLALLLCCCSDSRVLTQFQANH